MARSKMMERKKRWARGYAETANEKIKVLQRAQRSALSAGTPESRRLLALARSVLEADKRFQIVAIRDMRSPSNRRASAEAHKRLERAQAAWLRHYGVEPEFDWGYSSRQVRGIDAEIDALVERLRAQDVC